MTLMQAMLAPILTVPLSSWPQNQPQVSQAINLTHNQYSTQQSLHPKINILWNTKTSWNSVEIGETSWTDITNSKENTIEHLEERPQCLLPATLLQSSFHTKSSNHIWQSMMLEDSQVPQEPWDKLSSLLQTKFDSIVSKIIYRCGKNQLIWDGHSNHRTHHCLQTIPDSTEVSKICQWRDTTTRACRLHFQEPRSVGSSHDNSSYKTASFTSQQTTTVLGPRLSITK